MSAWRQSLGPRQYFTTWSSILHTLHGNDISEAFFVGLLD